MLKCGEEFKEGRFVPYKFGMTAQDPPALDITDPAISVTYHDYHASYCGAMGLLNATYKTVSHVF
jgi:hypothetical protein